MLIHLYICDFAVVKQLELDFNQGMTVITGETGAGKSILLDALSLTLGERADSQWVRPGCEKAEISATFDISHMPGALLWLADCELIGSESDQECIIRRVVYKNGRSKAFINGKVVTTGQLKLLGEYLIQIHGQHQHQLLLKPFEQLRLLDAFGQHDDKLSRVKKAFQHMDRISQEIETLKRKSQSDPSRLQFLEYQVNELEALALQEHEWETLNDEQKNLSHASADLEAFDEALQTLQEGEGCALEALQRGQNILGQLRKRHQELTPALELLKTAEIHLEEAIQEIDHASQSIDLSPERLDAVEKRLSAIYDLARKHKVEACELIPLYDKLYHEWQTLLTADDKIQSLEESLKQAQDYYVKQAQSLSKARQKAGKELAQKVTGWLEPLGIKGGQFEIELKSRKDYSEYGLEAVQFIVSTNPGHPLLPMQKVVSGGELSRISLAIQMITASYQSTPTLIFDEVDVGVGGKIGAVIGQALAQLGDSVQVLCITHLPQVAAMGAHHFQVAKHHEQSSTTTTIQALTHNQRVDELARMLGGLETTTKAKAHAKDLLKGHKHTEPA